MEVLLGFKSAHAPYLCDGVILATSTGTIASDLLWTFFLLFWLFSFSADALKKEEINLE